MQQYKTNLYGVATLKQNGKMGNYPKLITEASRRLHYCAHISSSTHTTVNIYDKKREESVSDTKKRHYPEFIC